MNFDRWTLEAGRRFLERGDARARQLELTESPSPNSKLSPEGNLPVAFLQGGLEASRAVVRIRIRDAFGLERGYADGALLPGGLVLTTHQMLPYASWAMHSLAEASALGDQGCDTFALDPTTHFATDEGRDFTLVAVRQFSEAGRGLSTFGGVHLSDLPPSIRTKLNLVHHPGGGSKQVSVRSCEVCDVLPDYLHVRQVPVFSYGGVLFDDQWRCVGILHAGIPVLWADGTVDVSGACLGAEALLMSSLKEEFESPTYQAGMHNLLKDVLDRPVREIEELDFDESEAYQPQPGDDALIRQLTADILASEDEEIAPEESDEPESSEEALPVSQESGHNVDFLGEDYPVFMPMASEGSVQTLAFVKHTILYDTALHVARVAAVDFSGKSYQPRPLPSELRAEPLLAKEHQPDLDVAQSMATYPLVTLETAWGKKAERAIKDVSSITNHLPVDFETGAFDDLKIDLIDKAAAAELRLVLLSGPVIVQERISGLFLIVCWVSNHRMNARAFLADVSKVVPTTVKDISRATGLDFGMLTSLTTDADGAGGTNF